MQNFLGTSLLCVLIPMSALIESEKAKSVESEDLMKTVISLEKTVREQSARLEALAGTVGRQDKAWARVKELEREVAAVKQALEARTRGKV